MTNIMWRVIYYKWFKYSNSRIFHLKISIWYMITEYYILWIIMFKSRFSINLIIHTQYLSNNLNENICDFTSHLKIEIDFKKIRNKRLKISSFDTIYWINAFKADLLTVQRLVWISLCKTFIITPNTIQIQKS